MSIPVDLDRLAAVLGDFPTAYLLTVGAAGKVKAVSADPVVHEGILVLQPSAGSAQSDRQSGRDPAVPPPLPHGYALLVDGNRRRRRHRDPVHPGHGGPPSAGPPCRRLAGAGVRGGVRQRLPAPLTRTPRRAETGSGPRHTAYGIRWGACRTRCSSRAIPDPDSSLPYLVRIPLGEGIVLRTRETWPRTSKVYCHRHDQAWSDDLEIIAETPLRSVTRRGAAIDIVADRTCARPAASSS